MIAVFALSFIEDAMGGPLVRVRNKYICGEVINELHSLRHDHNMPLVDAVSYMRGRLVPQGYVPYTFRPNVPESFLDTLRSLVGTCVFKGE